MITGLLNWSVDMLRALARTFGYETVVELSDHSIQIKFESPNSDKRAWDPDLYKYGQLFYAGYSNPLKIDVHHNPERGEKDSVSVSESDVDGSEDGGGVTEVISSKRYQQFMRQDLISQLLNPEDRWNKLLYGMLAIGAVQFLTIIAVLYVNGGF